MYLPGTISERIGDLRSKKGLHQKELAELIEISPSQLSRIETGETKNINAETIAKLAKALGVSADYILGLTTVSVPKSYDINELGLSEGAVKSLLMLKNSGATPMLNRLLEHKRFPSLMLQIKSYFYDELAMGVMGRNEIFDMAITSLNDLRKEQPGSSADIREGVRFINAEKIGKHEIDFEKIKTTFVAILRDIKQDIDDGGEAVNTSVQLDILQQFQAEMLGDTGGTVTQEQAAAEVTQRLEQMGIFNDETAEMFKKVAQSAMRKFEEDCGKEA